MIRGILLCTIAVLSAAFPWLFLVSYKSRCEKSTDEKRFKIFQNTETGWHLFLSIIGVILFLGYSENPFNWLAILALALSLLTIPEALLASLTGIYRKDRHRGYVDYYEEHKDPRKQFFASSKYPTLQVIGWIQFGLLVIIILLSILELRK
jgi:hypothetical protein